MKKWLEYEYGDVKSDVIEEDGMFYCSSKNMKDLITAESKTINGVIKAFGIAVDDYYKLRNELLNEDI